MDEIAHQRAIKKQDCREWTPLDALEHLVREIKAGTVSPTELTVHWFEDQKNGSRKHGYQCAGVTYSSHISLLNVALKCVLEDWME